MRHGTDARSWIRLAPDFLAAGLGLRLLDRLGGRPETPADALALAVPLGLGMLALAVLGLGELGIAESRQAWRFSSIGRSACSGRTHGVPRSWPWRADRPGLLSPGEGGRRPGEGRGTALAFALALAATLLGTLLTALAPVTDGDALCYHLQVPKVFLAQGAVGFEPDLHETVYPLVTELLYAVALAFRGPVACRLISWVLGLVFAANVTALARPSLGARAWWAGAVALLVPAVSNGMSAPLNDVALAAFGTAAIVGWAGSTMRPRRGVPPGRAPGRAGARREISRARAGRLAWAGHRCQCDCGSWAVAEPSRVTILFAAVMLAVGGPLVSPRALVHREPRVSLLPARLRRRRARRGARSDQAAAGSERVNLLTALGPIDAPARPVRQLRAPARAGVPAVPARTPARASPAPRAGDRRARVTPS